MRIVLIGTSHWHTPFYSDPVLGMKDATIVGVSDPDAERATPLAAQAKCPVFTYPASRNSSRHLVAATRPPSTRRRSNQRYFGPNTSMATRPALTAQGQPA